MVKSLEMLHIKIFIYGSQIYPEYVENHPEYKGKSVIINDKNREGDGFYARPYIRL